MQASLRLGVVIRLDKPKTFVPRGLVLFTLANAQRTLTYNDLEVALLVHPIAHVASVNAHLKGSLRGNALHVMLFLKNLIRALWIFNGLRSRHCQRALLVYHYQQGRVVKL